MESILQLNNYNAPTKCKSCGGRMIFKGVGEYKCEDCGEVAYDDYGKVRLYIEEHHGATASEIESAIGVKQKTIRQLLKEERLEVTPDSKTFLKCEFCGVDIRSGRFCGACGKLFKAKTDAMKEKKMKQVQGFGQISKGEDGAKRFERD